MSNVYTVVLQLDQRYDDDNLNGISNHVVAEFLEESKAQKLCLKKNLQATNQCSYFVVETDIKFSNAFKNVFLNRSKNRSRYY